MAQATVPIVSNSPVLRLDRGTGTLRSREYRLTVVGGPDAGKSLLIAGTSLVGSHPDAGLSLSDPTVSRYHLELQARADGVRIRDLESTDGPLIGGAGVPRSIVGVGAQVTEGQSQQP